MSDSSSSFKTKPSGHGSVKKLFDKLLELLDKGVTGTLTFRIDLKDGGIRNAEQEWRTRIDLK